VPSEIIGTGALWAALVAALVITVIAKPEAGRLARGAPWALVVLAIQSLHFAEEFSTGFHERFPALLGLAQWTPVFFVAFNMAWIAAWSLAIACAVTRRATFLASWLVWFLAMAAVGNGIAHPVLAVVGGGYFPGLVTSPVLGAAGIFLIRALMRRAV